MMPLLLSVQSTVEFLKSMWRYSRKPDKSAVEENSPKSGSTPKGLLKYFCINCCNIPCPLFSYSFNFFKCGDSSQSPGPPEKQKRNTTFLNKQLKDISKLNKFSNPHISGAVQIFEQ
jgi:hypothetical protein